MYCEFRSILGWLQSQIPSLEFEIINRIRVHLWLDLIEGIRNQISTDITLCVQLCECVFVCDFASAFAKYHNIISLTIGTIVVLGFINNLPKNNWSNIQIVFYKNIYKNIAIFNLLRRLVFVVVDFIFNWARYFCTYD